MRSKGYSPFGIIQHTSKKLKSRFQKDSRPKISTLGVQTVNPYYFYQTSLSCGLNEFLKTPLTYLKGMGPQKADLLSGELQVFSFGDLLEYYPFRYVDRSKIASVAQLRQSVDYTQARGVLRSLKVEGAGPKQRLKGNFADATGSIELIWFKGVRWLHENLKPGTEYLLYGKVSRFKGNPNIAHPELEKIVKGTIPLGFLQPVYSSTEKLTKRGLSSKGIEKLIDNLLNQPQFAVPETLPADLRTTLKLVSKRKAVQDIHRPKTDFDLRQARRRLKFEELFYLQLELLLKKELRNNSVHGFVFNEIGDAFTSFYENHLPFELTGAQKRVLKEIRRDMNSGRQMNRLLQGDVGSGKTIVATIAALISIDNGFQTALMAPTEILAGQHFATLSELLSGVGLRVELLTGSTKTAARRKIHTALEAGELDILIGTHALIEDKVKFKNLGLAIIDEQHRFGVQQRARLWRKNKLPPHILVMTATPIPRTLSMTLYGDLEVSIIDELPPGRKDVVTRHVYDSSRLKIFGFMEDQIRRGRQVYVVYPLIEESSTLDLKDLMDGYESITRRFQPPEYQVSIVHGKMKAADKDFEMNRFTKGETQILVATTVIEVGVNVPNASVMIIESAQRFGLSQLHQLRGRVGRGAEQSYCILATDFKLSSDARLRLNTMCETNDGFKIAEVDLQLRGPGDMMGTQQSGELDLKLADLASDAKILQFARNAVIELIDEDPDLSLEKNKVVKDTAHEMLKNKPNWSRIS